MIALLSRKNPILRAELKHQRHLIKTSQAGRLWILLALVMVIPGLLGALIFTVSAFIGTDLLDQWGLPSIVTELLTLDLIILNIAMFLVVTLITLGLASRSIEREQSGNTWDSLLLTQITARQIIWGKWWATLRALNGDHVMVGLVRVGLFSMVVVEWTNALAAANPATQLLSDQTSLPLPVLLLMAIGLLLIYTFIDAMFSSALGILTPLIGHQNAFFPLAIITRLFVSALTGGVFVFASTMLHDFMLGAVAMLLFFALFTWLTLWIAEMVAVQAHAAARLASPLGI